MSSGVRPSGLRSGSACVRCRKGKTKCVYDTGKAPCRNCAKGMHECYLPSESQAHIHGQSPARPAVRVHREAAGSGSESRIVAPTQARAAIPNTDKIGPELLQECERVVSKTFPACIAFHKPSFIQQLKTGKLNLSLVYALLCSASRKLIPNRSSPSLIRRFGGSHGATGAAEHFATKAMARIYEAIDNPSLADIQALCLIIIHEWGSRNAVRAYIYLGQVARMLHMYRILNSHQAQNEGDIFLREESFRRTLWLIYSFDCFLSSTPGRRAALSPSDLNGISLPCNDINFAFGNAVWVKPLNATDPVPIPAGVATGEIGEFGHVVLATRIWHNVIHMLTVTNTQLFDDECCAPFLEDLAQFRSSLPIQFVDKPGQIHLHITMGTGMTYAMIHSILHCSSIFLERRRLLQHVITAPSGNESWRASPSCRETVDRLLSSCQTITNLLIALESTADKDYIPYYPIFMLFSAFTASATVAYLSLKGLTAQPSGEMANSIVKDGLRLIEKNVDVWPLITSWSRHLSVMQRVLLSEANHSNQADSVAIPVRPSDASSHIKTEGGSSASGPANPNESSVVERTNGEAGSPHNVSDITVRNKPEDHEASSTDSVGEENGSNTHGNSPRPMSSLSVHDAADSGSSGPKSSPVPPPSAPVKPEGPATSPQPAATAIDMTALELCSAFEKQLLELDDLAAFMGGGV